LYICICTYLILITHAILLVYIIIGTNVLSLNEELLMRMIAQANPVSMSEASSIYSESYQGIPTQATVVKLEV